MEFFPPKPRTDSGSSGQLEVPQVVFHDFSSLLCSSSSLTTLDEETTLGLSLSPSGSCRKRKSTAQIESSSTDSSSSTAAAPRTGGRGKRAKTQLDDYLELRIGLPEPWTIRKKLERSDVNHMARLMLPRDAVEKHILAYWDEERVMKAKSKDLEGVSLTVYDWDVKVEKTLKLKQWGKGSPVLNDRWVPKFVHRRNLKEGDEIGLFWDQQNSRLNFSLISSSSVSSISPNY